MADNENKKIDIFLYYFGILIFTVYLINEAYFIINKKEINATIIEKVRDNGKFIFHLEFKYNNNVINDYFKVDYDIGNEVTGNSTIIYYDNFILKDIYFKTRHPYFVLKFLFYLVIYLVISIPITSSLFEYLK